MASRLSTSTRAPVTIIVPTFNRARYLPDTIRSLLAQSVAAEQLIIVNDGSDDDTVEALRPLEGQFLYLEKTNGGKCSAINFGLARATGKFIWIFDDDDLACPDALARHLEALDRDPGAGYTVSGSFRCEEDAASGVLRVISPQPVREFAPDDDVLELMLSSYIAGPSSVIRKELLDQVGPYREDLERADDFEMALRLALVSRPTRLLDRRPSYFRRWHGGLRGMRGQQFAFSQSVARSRDAERMVLRDMEVQLTPQHFLPRSEWPLSLDPVRRCRSALRRWVVAVQKAMWPECKLAHECLLHHAPGLDSLPVEDLAWTRRAFSDPHALRDIHATPEAMQLLAAQLRDARFKMVRRLAMQQFYYNLRAAVHGKDLTLGRLTLTLVLRLFGLRGAANTLLSR